MKHCMLLWKKPSAKPLQTQIDCAFDVFSVIRDLREELSLIHISEPTRPY